MGRDLVEGGIWEKGGRGIVFALEVVGPVFVVGGGLVSSASGSRRVGTGTGTMERGGVGRLRKTGTRSEYMRAQPIAIGELGWALEIGSVWWWCAW